MSKNISISLCIIVCFSMLFILSSCGGGNSVAGTIPSNDDNVSPGKGSFEVNIEWPDKNENTPRSAEIEQDNINAQVIHQSLVTVNITITGQGISTPVTATITRPENSKSFTGLPAGNKTVEFVGKDYNGTTISHRKKSITIIKNLTVTTTFQLGVTILDTGNFYPSTTYIMLEDTLFWVNNDDIPHQITIQPGSVKSGTIPPGGEFSYIFPGVGNYTYTSDQGISGNLVVYPNPPYSYERKWGGDGTFNGAYGISVTLNPANEIRIYVANSYYNTVKKFAPNGTGGNISGSFSAPRGVAARQTGELYVADTGNNRIQKFYNDVYQFSWGSFGSANGQFNFPSGIALDNSGYVYVVDGGNSRIQKFNSNGTWVKTIGGTQGSGNGQFYNPCGVAVDKYGQIYVADTDNNRIQKFNSSGTWMSNFTGNFNMPLGVGVDASGNVFVCDSLSNRIHKYAASTGTNSFIGVWGARGPGNGQFEYPVGIGADPSAYTYVLEFGNSGRIQVFKIH